MMISGAITNAKKLTPFACYPFGLLVLDTNLIACLFVYISASTYM